MDKNQNFNKIKILDKNPKITKKFKKYIKYFNEKLDKIQDQKRWNIRNSDEMGNFCKPEKSEKMK